ncbi:unnamed protein product [Soboliphyme baturini]|uniref:Exodeoxyribonuclease VII large subunit n=1 Tax=Soboliphyme baturini TaxID=241478 RepID=A0A183IM22_9BILA|nr:unnamed protein product [Soboliphyme baturini]
MPQGQSVIRQQQRSQITYMSRTLTLNATIRDAQQWSQHQGPGLSLLFDIYAVLDSEVQTNTFGGLEFELRDHSGSVKATYFQMEEPMINANIGDWLRVEAVVRYWGFQVTHLKLAEPTYLIGLREKIAASRRALEERIRCQSS